MSGQRIPQYRGERRSGGVKFAHGGKHRGWPLAAIPLAYLQTAQGWALNERLMAAVDAEVRYRRRHERSTPR